MKSMHLMDRGRAISQEDEIVPPMLLEASVQPFKLVGPDRKSMMKVRSWNEPGVEANPNCCKLGSGFQSSSGPDIPLGFENIWVAKSVMGHEKNQERMLVTMGQEKKMGKRIDFEHSIEESFYSTSADRTPQTPLVESNLNRHGEIEEFVMPIEDELVEAKVIWDIGKTLGCQVNNEEVMSKALATVHDCQDFVLPRKRGRPKKNKGKSKN